MGHRKNGKNLIEQEIEEIKKKIFINENVHEDEIIWSNDKK